MNKSYSLLILLILLPGVLLFSSNACAENNRRPGIREIIQKRSIARINTPGDYDLFLNHNNRIRKYHIHVPPVYTKETSTPVVIYLHGGGGSINSWKKDGMAESADKFGFILVAPAGTGILLNRLLTWNSGEWEGGECCGYAIKHNINDVEFISRLIDKLRNILNVDEKRIYSTGISNGGMMSYRLACELSDKIAAIAVVAPPAVLANCVPSHPVAVMHIHGTADPCAPFDGGEGGGCLGKSKRFNAQSAPEMVGTWIQNNNCSQNFVTTYKNGNATCIQYEQCTQGSDVEFCTIEDGGHTWPSGKQYLPIKRIGPVSYDISFDQIWEFFERHKLD